MGEGGSNNHSHGRGGIDGTNGSKPRFYIGESFVRFEIGHDDKWLMAYG